MVKRLKVPHQDYVGPNGRTASLGTQRCVQRRGRERCRPSILDFRIETATIDTPGSLINMGLLLVGVFVYRLGHGPLKAERRVRFPYALPIATCVSDDSPRFVIRLALAV